MAEGSANFTAAKSANAKFNETVLRTQCEKLLSSGGSLPKNFSLRSFKLQQVGALLESRLIQKLNARFNNKAGCTKATQKEKTMATWMKRQKLLLPGFVLQIIVTVWLLARFHAQSECCTWQLLSLGAKRSEACCNEGIRESAGPLWKFLSPPSFSCKKKGMREWFVAWRLNLQSHWTGSSFYLASKGIFGGWWRGPRCFVFSLSWGASKCSSLIPDLPSHNIRKHVPGLLLVMSFPALCKTQLDAIGFHAATLHWAYARLFHGISPLWHWTVVVFGATVSCFSVWHTSPPPRFQQTFCGMQPLTW